MKKSLALFLVLLALVPAVPAGSAASTTSAVSAAGQKYFAVSSEEWQFVRNLCHYAGVAGPSSAGPVTEGQLLVAIERAEAVLGPSDALVLHARELLEPGFVFISDDLGSIGGSVTIQPAVYVQTKAPDLEDFTSDPDRDWFVWNYQDTPALADLELEVRIRKNLYGRFDFGVYQKLYSGSNYYTQTFHTNVFLLGPGFAQYFPFDAGISIGSGTLNLIIARARMSLGEGCTGNTAIGDVYDFQEFIKLGFSARRWGISLSLTSFDSSHDPLLSGPSDMFSLLSARYGGFQQLRQAITYEILPVDSLRASISMLNILDTSGSLDFRMFNPFNVFHNMYNYHNDCYEANNFMTVDVSWSPARHWNIYGQFSLDQFQLSGEVRDYDSDLGYVDPDAFGFLANVSYTDTVGKGMLNAWLEAVVNWPGMYLNEKYYDASDNITQQRTDASGNPNRYCWSQDMLMGYYRRGYDGANDIAFSGYTYGPDCAVLALGCEYSAASWNLESSVLYLAHGEKGTGTDPRNYTYAGIDTPETYRKLPLVGELVEHTLNLTLRGCWDLASWVSVNGGLSYSYRWNYNHEAGRILSNLQAAFGVKVSTK